MSAGAVYDTARHPWAPSLCIAQGMIARRFGQGLRANPHPKGSPEWRCWRHGHSPVSRETVSLRSGDERGERWPPADENFLIFAAGDLNGPTMAAILGRSHQALRCKLHRMKKARTL